MHQGTCEGCGRKGVWVNAARVPLGNRTVEWKQYCGDCFESRLGISKERRPKTGGSGPAGDPDPSQENAIRELEDGV